MLFTPFSSLSRHIPSVHLSCLSSSVFSILFSYPPFFLFTFSFISSLCLMPLSLLTEIERHEGIVFLATNRPHDLDEAMHRRITAVLEYRWLTASLRIASHPLVFVFVSVCSCACVCMPMCRSTSVRFLQERLSVRPGATLLHVLLIS